MCGDSRLLSGNTSVQNAEQSDQKAVAFTLFRVIRCAMNAVNTGCEWEFRETWDMLLKGEQNDR
jgi:hypothetical protein